MSDIQVTAALDPSEWEAYKRLRLEALRTEPQAYGKSYEELAARPDSYWQERLAGAQRGDHMLLFAKEGSEVVGVVAAASENGEKIKHRVHVDEVYVLPDSRGKGVARMLMEALEKHCLDLGYVIVLSLNVAHTQEAARHLYESLGFKEIGTIQKDVHIADAFYDTDIMEKFIR